MHDRNKSKEGGAKEAARRRDEDSEGDEETTERTNSEGRKARETGTARTARQTEGEERGNRGRRRGGESRKVTGGRLGAIDVSVRKEYRLQSFRNTDAQVR